MGWPLSQEYNEAIQSPRAAFGDPLLQTGTVVPGPLGIPLPRSGNFADVYQLRAADASMWAIKCFTRPAAGLRERYQQVDAHLRAARLPFSVGFQFLPEGVRVRGLWYPVLKMAWVEGVQLNEFVRNHLDRPEHLKALLGLWVRLCRRLREACIAHGDLQHGNVLLVPGTSANKLRLRLIDYDGMWVPSLAHNPSGEAGHPAYQHPARLRDRIYSIDVDRFPHLIIGCALRALAVAGRSLWERFDNGDNLLFREADIADPASSPLVRQLWDMNDPALTNLLALLVLSARQPMASTPWLDQVLESQKPVPVSSALLARAADALGVEQRQAPQAIPVAQLYVVPDEATQFADFNAVSAARRRRRAVNPVAAVLVLGTLALLAAAATVAIVSMQESAAPEQPLQSRVSPQPNAAPKSGIVETRWTKVKNSEPVALRRNLVSGLDVAPPGTTVVRTIRIGDQAVRGAWLLTDGRHALVAGRTGLGIVDLHTAKVVPIPQAASEPQQVVLAPDCAHAVTVDAGRLIQCFALGTGENLWSHRFPGTVGGLAISPDSQRVAATGDGVGYLEWQLKDGTEVRRHEALQAHALCFTPAGDRALAATSRGLELWSLDDATISTLEPSFAATSLSVHPDGKLAFAASGGHDVKAWDLENLQALSPRRVPLRQAITVLGISRDGTMLVGSQAGEVSFVGLDESAATFSIAAEPIVSVSPTDDSEYALLATAKTLALTRLADSIRSDGPSRTGPLAGCLELVRSVAIAPESAHFASAGDGNQFLATVGPQVTVYDAARFRREKTMALEQGRIVAAGFGPSQLIVVCESTGDQYRTRAYDLKRPVPTPGPSFKIDDREIGRVTRLVAVPSRPWVVATTEVGDVLFDVNSAEPVEGWPLPTPDAPISSAVSQDGQRFAVIAPDELVRIWSSELGGAVGRLEQSLGVVALAFLPGGTNLVGVWPHGRLRIWDVITGTVEREIFHDYPGPFAEIAVLSTDTVLLGPAPNRVLLNLKTRQALNTGNGPDPLERRGLVMPSRGWVLAVDRDDRLSAWRVNTRRAEVLPAKPTKPTNWPNVAVVRDAPNAICVGLSFSANGKTVLVATQDGKLTRFSVDKLYYEEEFDTKEPRLRAVVQRGDVLFTLNQRFELATRDALTFKSLATLPSSMPTGSTGTVLAVHPSGALALVVSDKPRLVDVPNKRQLTVAAAPKAASGRPLTQFTWSADGATGLARWGDAVTAIWHPKKIGHALVLEVLEQPISAAPEALALSPDGDRAILGTADGRIVIWNARTGELLHESIIYPRARAEKAITAIHVLPGGTEFLSLGGNGRVMRWDMANFKVIEQIHCPPGPWRLAVAPDARSAVMHQPGMILRIDLPPGSKR